MDNKRAIWYGALAVALLILWLIMMKAGKQTIFQSGDLETGDVTLPGFSIPGRNTNITLADVYSARGACACHSGVTIKIPKLTTYRRPNIITQAGRDVHHYTSVPTSPPPPKNKNLGIIGNSTPRKFSYGW